MYVIIRSYWPLKEFAISAANKVIFFTVWYLTIAKPHFSCPCGWPLFNFAKYNPITKGNIAAGK